MVTLVEDLLDDLLPDFRRVRLGSSRLACLALENDDEDVVVMRSPAKDWLVDAGAVDNNDDSLPLSVPIRLALSLLLLPSLLPLP